ncbi:MAG: hypothetical protein HOB73_03215 [Planctomycetaceae bacterium]|jgi:hypothetical protein|nr:hypothetical protein [Planctomycetaceae bacterium]
MHAAALLQTGIDFANEQGIEVRLELLDGSASGMCVYGGKKCIFLDLAQNSLEQLYELGVAIIRDAGIGVIDLPSELQSAWGRL